MRRLWQPSELEPESEGKFRATARIKKRSGEFSAPLCFRNPSAFDFLFLFQARFYHFRDDRFIVRFAFGPVGILYRNLMRFAQ